MKRLFYVLLLCILNAPFLYSQETYQHLIINGQSLSTGSQSYPAVSTENEPGNFMIGDQVWIEQGNPNQSEFKPLIGKTAENGKNNPLTVSSQTMAESPVIGAANHLQRKQAGQGIKYLATSVGEPGRSIEALSKEMSIAGKKNYYNDYFLKSLSSASTIAQKSNSKVESPAIFWMQGEFNYREIFDDLTPLWNKSTSDKDAYLNLFIKLKNNMQDDIVKQYGQAKKPVFITYQAGSVENNDKTSIGNALIEASNTYTDVINAGPTYQMPRRGLHMDANGYRWFGEMLGKVYYKTQVLKEDFKPLQPKKIYRINSNTVGVEFLVPKGDLVFDTDIVPLAPNYGFVVKLNGTEQTINSVKIEGNVVIITCASALNGEVAVSYGNNIIWSNGEVVNKTGNLRDSDDSPSFYTYVDFDEKDANGNYIYQHSPTNESLRPDIDKNRGRPVIEYNKRYPLYNFSVAFEHLLPPNQQTIFMPGFFSQEIVYVKKGGTGDGSSWSSPLGEVADALKLVKEQNSGEIQNIKQIWVAKGTYTPKYRADNFSGQNPLDRLNSFVLPKNVSIYGGFSGTESSLDQRDWKNNVTVLSGDLNGNDGANFANTTDNTYHVVTSVLDSNTILDGFTISGGNADHNNWTSVSVNGGSIFANSGGGIYLYASTAKLQNLILSNNQAYASGGAIRMDGGTPELTNVIINDNKITNNAFGGSGIYNNKGTLTLRNALIYKNQTAGRGGGIYNEGASTTLTNVSVTENVSSLNDGHGIYNDASSTSLIQNSIIWGNKTTSNISGGGSYTYTYSLIQGVTTNTNNNIDGNTDPLFANSEDEDYRLIDSSPLINAGNNSYASGIATDLNGNPRIFDTTIDLGAYEAKGDLPNRTWYVKQNSTGDGSSWDNALGDLQDAINKAFTNDEIWVAQGTYKPNRRADNLKVITTNDRDNSFVLKKNIKIYGGFQGTETKLSQRKLSEYPSILSGDLGTANNATDNAYHVVISSGYVGVATLDGFTITAGNANYSNWSTITVNGGTIFRNLGGGVYILESAPTLTNLIITGNEAFHAGGGIRLDASTVTISNVRIENNKVTNNTYGGGGIYNNKGNLTLINSLLYKNQSAAKGGAIYNEGTTSNTLTNVTISGNTSTYGGGSYSEAGSSTKIKNSIIWSNGNSNIYGGNNTYNYSLVQSVTTTDANGNINGNTDPLFESASTGNFYLTENSPVIDKGNSSYLDSSIVKDLANNKRIMGDHVDMGAYEYEICFWGDSSLEDKTVVYNGSPQELTVQNPITEITISYLYKGVYPTVYTESATPPTDAGEYEVTATLTSTESTCETTLTAHLTIDKAPAVISATEIQKLNYDGSIKNISAALNHTEAALEYFPQQGYSYVGTYPITISVPETKNYLAATKDVTLVIEDLTNFPGASFSDATFVYDGSTHKIEVSGVPNGTDVSYPGISNQQINAGTYTVTAVLEKSGKKTYYSAILTIDKAPAVITTTTPQTHVYDGTVKSITASLNHKETTLVYDPQQEYTDAGNYTVKITAAETANYLSANATVDLIINKADFQNIVFEDLTTTYDKNAHTILASGYPEGTTVTYSDNSKTIAGIYTAKVTLTNPNYNETTYTAVLTINKAPSVITEEVFEYTYDGTEKKLVASLNHNEEDLTYSPQQAYTEAGTYPITISIVETQNYLANSKKVDLIINKATMENLTLLDETVIFNKTPQGLKISGTPPSGTSEVYEYEGINPTVYPKSTNAPTNAGKYSVTATLTNPNYNTETLTATLTINKAQAVITASTPQTYMYDGSVKNADAALNHTESTLSYNPQQGYTDVGSYTIDITAPASENYEETSKTVTLIINPASITGVKLDSKTTTYDGTPKDHQITGTPPHGTSVVYEYEGISPTAYTKSTNPPVNAGKYQVTATLTHPNYVTLSLTTTLTINKATPVITAVEEQIHTYDGIVKNILATLNHGESALTYTPQQGYTDAGTYSITITAPESENYKSLDQVVKLIINKSTLSGITFDSKDVTYNGSPQPVQITGTPPSGTTVVYEYEGIDPTSYTKSTTPPTDAGSYKVTVTLTNQNYEKLEISTTLTINPAQFTGITLKDQTKTFNKNPHGLVIDGTAPTGTTVIYEYEGINPTVYTKSQTAPTNAGSYTVTATLTNPNFNQVSVSATLIINKAQAVITVNTPQTHTYDGIVKNVNATLDHTETSLTYDPMQGYTDAGTYSIKVFAVETANYLKVEKTVSLIINKQTFSGITFNNKTETFDNTQKKIQISGSTPTGTTVVYEYEGINPTVYPKSTNPPVNAGSYTVTATLTNPNYVQDSFTATLTINKAQAVITAAREQIHTYDGNVKNVVATLNHSETALTFNPQQGYTDAGTYSIKITAAETANYLGTEETVNLKINKPSLNGVALDSKTEIYNGDPHPHQITGTPPHGTSVVYEYEGIAPTAYTKSTTPPTDAGTYMVTATLTNPNYQPEILENTLTIKPKVLEGITFDSKDVTYNGSPQPVQITGTPPSGTTVVYEYEGIDPTSYTKSTTPPTDAGSYKVTVTLTNQNYEKLEISTTLTINPAQFTGITLKDQTKTFNKNPHGLVIDGTAPTGTTVIYEYEGINPTVYTKSQTAPTNAGSYTVTATLTNPNFNQVSVSATLIINKAQAVITVNTPQTHTYDGIVKNVNATLDHTETSLTYDPMQGYTDAGTYSIKVFAVETANYLKVEKTVSLIINKQTFSGITFNNKTETFDNTQKKIQISGSTPTGTTVVYEYEGINPTVYPKSTNPPVNAGSYTVTATLTNPNYVQDSFTATLTINKAQAVITAAREQIHTYDGNVKNVVATLNHSETALTFNPQQGYTDAGTYSIKITAAETANYLGTEETVNLKINKPSLNGVALDSKTEIYNGDPHPHQITGTPPHGTSVVYEYEGIAPTAYTKSTTPPTDAGTYMVTATLTNPNYDPEILTNTLTIKPKVLEGITFDSKDVTYNGSPQPVQITGTTPSGTTVVYEYEGIDPTSYTKSATPPTDAGSYKVTVTLTNPNYEKLEISMTLNIKKAAAVITAANPQIHVYDGTNKEVVASLNHTESVLTFSPQKGYTDVGTYSITVKALESQNYMEATATIDLRIDKASASGVTMDSKTVTYNKNPQGHVITGTPPNGTSVIYEYEGINPTVYPKSTTPPTNAGSYMVTATLTNPNYDTETVSNILMIEKASTKITAEAEQTYTYDGTVKNVIASMDHSESSLTYSPQQGYTDANTYSITITAPESENYKETSKIVSLVINKAAITGVNFTGKTVTYDGNIHSLTAINLPVGASVTYDNNDQVNAGTYTVTATITSPNYKDLTLYADLIISKATFPADIIMAGKTVAYNGNTHSLEVTNLPAYATVSYMNNDKVDAGTYTVTATVSNVNYEDLILTEKLVITKAIFPADIKMEGKTVAYDGTTHSLKVINLPAYAAVSYKNNDKINAGTYTVTATVSNINYEDLILTEDLVITKATFPSNITMTGKTVTYDGTVHSLEVINLPTVLPDNSTADVTYQNNAQVNAGTYTVTATISNVNYEDLILNADLTINKAESKITTEDQTYIYDGTVKNLEASLNHNEDVLSFSPQQGYIEPGTYPITVYVQESQNYMGTSVKATLVISPKLGIDEPSITVKEIRVAPNPMSTVVKVFFPAPVTEKGTIQIFDLVGRLVAQVPVMPGDSVKEIDVRSYYSGVYILRYNNKVVKLIKE